MKKVLILIFCVFSFSCERNPKQTGIEIAMLTDMVRPVPYESFSKNTNFENGRTLQEPVKGTVYRGQLDYLPQAKGQAKNPVPLNNESLVRGKFIFQHYCLVCHGVEGAGDGPMIPKYTNPPALDSKRLLKLSDLELFQIISNGKRDMPSHSGQILPEDRWNLIWYVRKLQGVPKG